MSDTSGRPEEASPIADIDLDRLARSYRFRPISQLATVRALAAARNALDPLLDVGGGTGAHSAAWAAVGRTAVVADMSHEMARIARTRRHVMVTRADAAALPFVDDSFGLAYFHMSIHYGEWRTLLNEALRVVRPGGSIEIWTFAPAAIGASSLGRWFPSVVAIDAERFPDPVDLASHLSMGASKVKMSEHTEGVTRSADDWVRSVRGRFVSTLQVLTDDELEAGIAEFRKAYPRDTDPYSYELKFTLVACVV